LQRVWIGLDIKLDGRYQLYVQNPGLGEWQASQQAAALLLAEGVHQQNHAMAVRALPRLMNFGRSKEIFDRLDFKSDKFRGKRLPANRLRSDSEVGEELHRVILGTRLVVPEQRMEPVQV